jgi:hypothetical protein
MPLVRLDLTQKTYEALAERAVRERRPVPWQAEVLIEAALSSTATDADRVLTTTTPTTQTEVGHDRAS